MLHVTRVLEGELLPGYLVHDALAVVVAQASAQLVVVHPGLVLACAPVPGNLLRLQDAEFVAVAGPLDHVLLVRGEQQVEQELPQLDGPTADGDCAVGVEGGRERGNHNIGREEGGGDRTDFKGLNMITSIIYIYIIYTIYCII